MNSSLGFWFAASILVFASVKFPEAFEAICIVVALRYLHSYEKGIRELTDLLSEIRNMLPDQDKQ